MQTDRLLSNTDLACPRVHLKPQAIAQPPHGYLQPHNARESAQDCGDWKKKGDEEEIVGSNTLVLPVTYLLDSSLPLQL